MTKWMISLLVSLMAATALAEPTLEEQLVRYDLVQSKYKRISLDLVDVNLRESLQSWYRLYFNDVENRRIYARVMGRLRATVRGSDYRNLLYYYHMTGQVENAANVLGYYYLSLRTVLENYATDPFYRNESLHRSGIEQALVAFTANHITRIEKCYRDSLSDKSRKFDLKKSSDLLRLSSRCLRDSNVASLIWSAERLFTDNRYRGPRYPVSYTGFVGGNAVELFAQTPTAPDVVTTLGDQLGLLHTALHTPSGKKYIEMTKVDFSLAMETPTSAVDTFFTEAEGFLPRDEHPTLGPIGLSQPGIYQQVLSSIDQAQQSVYVDIFWMGGSIGVQLAKTLLKKTIENPQFQVFIVSDRENKFNHGPQLDVVYNYMRAYSEKFPELHFYVVPANLTLKRTALPEFIDLLFTNSLVNLAKSNDSVSDLLSSSGYNVLAKSDHSKVVIVDGNSRFGKAYVGSKNWTDASGGVAVDEVAEIRGPAVYAILNNFYYDALEAFLLEDRRSDFVTRHLQAKFPEIRSKYAGIQRLLAPIDVLSRWERKSNKASLDVVTYGDSVIGPAQNNIYGTEISPIDQNIHAILRAERQIIVDDQFLYDPAVVDALKVALRHHNVKLYIMLEPMTAVGSTDKVMAHVPNNLFLPELIELGAQARWKKIPQSILTAILASKEKTGFTLAPEFHLKSVSVDGVGPDDTTLCQDDQPRLHGQGTPALITGSANKDVMTMTGGFREYQALIYSETAVIRHDCLFWSRWNNPDSTETTDGLDFEIPPDAAKLGLNKENFLNVLRMVFFSTYNFTKDFFTN